ncbi:ABC-2 type transport system ATP-binding protein [Sediminihabitans luteus]|uniref:ABC-2 type transport system ATP-binding protein n=1 Tax=Sediminihabitans luteus TaxID=1138585 RepID=A0A2M9D0T7_9CELL|nr:ABC transporter ATP-binding protein [Sediminihabitans luteus]PJJ77770.1 ABC-2 type transport system ATP-binding protein [Sediminihabitans luteus]GIJ00003.1 ABC transporter ATP-binding protein [Sediminihabitans luteus]
MTEGPGGAAARRAGPTLVEVDRVTKRFGDVTALDDVSLSVGPGELVGMLGPNGAGKSTLLSLVSGQRRPDAGTVRLGGGDPRDAASRVPLGLTPQETGLPPTLRVGEVVEFVGRHYPSRVPTAELLDRFGLADLAKRQTGSLSGGQKRRLAVALSLVGRPRVVLLDEPTTGLDVGARQALWAAIREYHADGGTVLLTSHYLEEVQELAQRVVVIDRGVVRADAPLETALAQVALRRVLVRSDAPLDALPGVVRAERVADPGTAGDPRWELYTPDADALVRELVTSGTPFHGLEIRGASLEEAFEQMVAHDAVRTDERSAR